MKSDYIVIDAGVDKMQCISIAILTYNQESYIAQAIEGVLMQRTEYSYEIVIADDFSLDNTRNVISEYQRRNPDRVKLILGNKNVGSNENLIRLLRSLSGKYIAILDGDDYWTDPLKLQRQVAFLEKNADFSSCFHCVKILKEGKVLEDDMMDVNDVTTVFDLARGNYIRTCSFIYRRNSIELLPDDFNNIVGADYFIFMLSAKSGKIKKMREEMAVYRKHDGGIWSNNDSTGRYKILLRNVEVLFPYFSDDVSRILKERHAELFFRYVSLLVRHKLADEEKGYLSEVMRANMDVIFRKISLMIQDNNLFKSRQKSLKLSIRTTLGLIKARLSQYFHR